MNIVLALTFGEETAKTVIGAVATGLFVALLGGGAAAILTRWWEARRENFELKTRLLEQVARTAQKMYVACQHTRRILGKDPATTARGAEALVALDATYHTFSADAEAIETVIGARYGIRWGPPEERTRETPPPESDSSAFWRWHQIKDLLTAYYFDLKGSFPGDALKGNTKGQGGKFHSGLDLVGFFAGRSNDDALDDMRPPIRAEYGRALPALTRAIMTDKIKTR